MDMHVYFIAHLDAQICIDRSGLFEKWTVKIEMKVVIITVNLTIHVNEDFSVWSMNK